MAIDRVKMARRCRSAGHGFERDIVNELKDLGYPGVVTARSESRNMDNRGVDVFDLGIEEGPPFPYYIQNKCMITQPKFYNLIMDDIIPKNKPMLVFFRQTEKVKSRFMSRGDYVLMKNDVFEEFIIGKPWSYIIAEMKGNQKQPNVHKYFKDLPKDTDIALSYFVGDVQIIAVTKECFYKLIKVENACE